jgi:branched-subunit amino acid transport protein AzlD
MLLLDKVIFAGVLITATQITRVIPLAFENKITKLVKKEAWRNIISDIMFLLLILYCFRDLSFSTEYYLRVVVAVLVFAIQYKYERTLMSIILGTSIYMTGRYFI